MLVRVCDEFGVWVVYLLMDSVWDFMIMIKCWMRGSIKVYRCWYGYIIYVL